MCFVLCFVLFYNLGGGDEEIPREGSKVDCTSLPWTTLLPTWQNVVGSLGLMGSGGKEAPFRASHFCLFAADGM